jgi:gamma-glutamyltranspeptidase
MRANDQRDRQLSDPDIHGFAQERWLGHARIRQLVDEANDVAAGRAPVVPGESGIRATGDTVAVVATDEEEWAVSLIQSVSTSSGPRC